MILKSVEILPNFYTVLEIVSQTFKLLQDFNSKKYMVSFLNSYEVELKKRTCLIFLSGTFMGQMGQAGPAFLFPCSLEELIRKTKIDLNWSSIPRSSDPAKKA